MPSQSHRGRSSEGEGSPETQVRDSPAGPSNADQQAALSAEGEASSQDTPVLDQAAAQGSAQAGPSARDRIQTWISVARSLEQPFIAYAKGYGEGIQRRCREDPAYFGTHKASDVFGPGYTSGVALYDLPLDQLAAAVNYLTEQPLEFSEYDALYWDIRKAGDEARERMNPWLNSLAQTIQEWDEVYVAHQAGGAGPQGASGSGWSGTADEIGGTASIGEGSAEAARGLQDQLAADLDASATHLRDFATYIRDLGQTADWARDLIEVDPDGVAREVFGVADQIAGASDQVKKWTGRFEAAGTVREFLQADGPMLDALERFRADPTPANAQAFAAAGNRYVEAFSGIVGLIPGLDSYVPSGIGSVVENATGLILQGLEREMGQMRSLRDCTDPTIRPGESFSCNG